MGEWFFDSKGVSNAYTSPRWDSAIRLTRPRAPRLDTRVDSFDRGIHAGRGIRLRRKQQAGVLL
jgi:hypothetical protein